VQPAAIDSEFQEKAPQRRCFATGAVRQKSELVRFVIAPDGGVVPDIEEKLPGRGLWLTASRDIVTASSGKNLFARAARSPARAPANLADQVEALLTRRCLDLLGFARRAGQVTTGFEKVRSWLGAGKASLLLEANDGAEDGRRKLAILAKGLPVIDLFGGNELSQALGRENAVHVAVRAGKLGALLRQEAARLAGFREPTGNDETKPYGRNSEGR
jgi:uncharacterized protein